MNAYSWEFGVDIRDMLRAVQSYPSGRKNRLLSTVCARALLPLIEDDRITSCVQTAEMYADREVRKDQLKSVRRIGAEALAEMRQRVLPVVEEIESRGDYGWMNTDLLLLKWRSPKEAAPVLAAKVAIATCDTSMQNAPSITPVVWWTMHSLVHLPPAPTTDGSITVARLIRDIFPNPFVPTTFSSAWRTEAAVSLAETMYAARDFANLPVLADALEEAGCDNPDVLAHCRGPGPHVRGCWVVDHVLGKT